MRVKLLKYYPGTITPPHGRRLWLIRDTGRIGVGHYDMVYDGYWIDGIDAVFRLHDIEAWCPYEYGIRYA